MRDGHNRRHRQDAWASGDPVLLTAFRAGRPEHTPEAEDVLLHVEDGEATLVADDGETFTFSLRELRAALGDAA